MANWNYRVIEFIDPNDGPRRSIHEVYYDDGRPTSYTKNPAQVVSFDEGSNDCELSWVLDRMRDALHKPVLRESDFRF